MRLLIVGASGQIGGHLLSQASDAGHLAVGTWNGFQRPGLVKLDLDDDAALAAAVRDVRPDAVVLSAGWTWVDGNEDDPARARRLNRDQPLALCRLARQVGARFVTYSTDYVFDGQAGPYAEDDPTAPLSVYGRAKLEAEEAIRAETPDHLLLRTTTVFGPEAQGKNFVYQLVKRLRQGQPMQVPVDQWASPSYGPDVAAATLALIERGASGTWHVAGPDQLDRAAFARLACRVFGLDERLVEGKTTAELRQKAARPLRGGLRTDKLRAAGIALRDTAAGLAAMKAEIEAGRAAAP